MGNEVLRDLFDAACERYAAKKAISFIRDGQRETELTYRQLAVGATRMANWLASAGVGRRRRVLFLIEKSVFAVVAHLAVLKIGATSVPLNPGFKGAELNYLLKDADAALAFTTPANTALVKTICPELRQQIINPQTPYRDIDFFRSFSAQIATDEVKPQDPGLIIYTSGTTGNPKGAILTQTNLVRDTRNVIDIWEISADDVICHVLPLFHVHGLCFALHTALIAGARVVMANRFSPPEIIRSLADSEPSAACTLFMAVPAMYTKLMDSIGQESFDFSHLRLITSGSAPLLRREFKRIKSVFGQEPVEREGMSETGMNFSNPVRGIRKPGSIGLPLPGLRVRIVSPETYEDRNPGDVGEIWLQGPAVTPGYWRKPRETEAAFQDGWFKTGDLGYVDQEGYYYLTDRIKHIIISGGENISAKEVELVINRLETVVESAVVGISDPKWGEKVVAAVVLQPGAVLQPAEIQSFCRQHLHDWKSPKEIRLVKALPKNTMGKVLTAEVKVLFSHS